MTTDARNTRIVLALIGSMTLGAAALLWLEPPAEHWSPLPLTAEAGATIERVEIRYLSPGADEDDPRYDCVVRPDRAPQWRPSGADLSIAVVNDDDDERLADGAKHSLMAVLGGIRAAAKVEQVEMAPQTEDPAPAERELREMLERKGMLR